MSLDIIQKSSMLPEIALYSATFFLEVIKRIKINICKKQTGEVADWQPGISIATFRYINSAQVDNFRMTRIVSRAGIEQLLDICIQKRN